MIWNMRERSFPSNGGEGSVDLTRDTVLHLTKFFFFLCWQFCFQIYTPVYTTIWKMIRQGHSGELCGKLRSDALLDPRLKVVNIFKWFRPKSTQPPPSPRAVQSSLIEIWLHSQRAIFENVYLCGSQGRFSSPPRECCCFITLPIFFEILDDKHISETVLDDPNYQCHVGSVSRCCFTLRRLHRDKPIYLTFDFMIYVLLDIDVRFSRKCLTRCR